MTKLIVTFRNFANAPNNLLSVTYCKEMFRNLRRGSDQNHETAIVRIADTWPRYERRIFRIHFQPFGPKCISDG